MVRLDLRADSGHHRRAGMGSFCVHPGGGPQTPDAGWPAVWIREHTFNFGCLDTGVPKEMQRIGKNGQSIDGSSRPRGVIVSGPIGVRNEVVPRESLCHNEKAARTIDPCPFRRVIDSADTRFSGQSVPEGWVRCGGHGTPSWAVPFALQGVEVVTRYSCPQCDHEIAVLARDLAVSGKL